jgi:glycosyltransferase involved in cell wall biosynthesis
MANPLVSVITPCFRQAHYLPAAVETVLSQSYRPVQMVVVNDGSDDNTKEVARRYGDRIRYVAQPNGGLAAARNAGLKVADAPYLLFLDADDLLHPDAVAWLVEAMDGGNDRVCVMGFRKFETDPATGEWADSYPPEERPLARRLIFENLAPPHAFLCPRSLVEAAGGFDRRWTNGCEDWDLWMRLALAGAEVVPVPRVGAFYRRYEGSMSMRRARMYWMSAHLLLQARRQVQARPDRLRAWELTYPDVVRRQQPLLQEAFLGAAYNLRKEGCYARCLGNYLQSIYWTGWSGEALQGLMKLPAQWLLRK